MKQLELDEFSNWWLKGADVAFIQLVKGSSLQILCPAQFSVTQYPDMWLYSGWAELWNEWLSDYGALGCKIVDKMFQFFKDFSLKVISTFSTYIPYFLNY